MTGDETAVLGVAAAPPPASSMKYLPTKEMTGVDLFYMHNYVQRFVQIVICYIESWVSYVSDG